MNEKKLFKAIGQIDDELIMAAADSGNKSGNKLWLRWAAMAACLAVIVAAALVLPRLNENETQYQNTPSSDYQDERIEGSLALAPLSVTATEYSGDSISTDSGFIISANGLTADLVESQVSISGDLDFTVSEVDEDSFLIQPAQPVEESSVVSIRFADEDGNIVSSWAFQTQGSFNLVSTYPAQGDVVSQYSGVEFTFNTESVDLKLFEEAFSIEPQVEGSFNLRGRTVVFAPNDTFSPGTDYTVTLGGTVADLFGQALGEDISFTFSVQGDGDENTAFNASYSGLYSFLPDEQISLPVSIKEEYLEQSLEVQLYAYNSFDTFAEDIYNEDEGLEERINELSLAAEYSARQTTASDGAYNQTGSIIFPETLQAGLYVARISLPLGDGTYDSCWAHVQVSELSVYACTTDDQTMIWINDVQTGQVSANAEIELSGLGESITSLAGDEGYAIMDLPRKTNGGKTLMKIQNQGKYFASVLQKGEYYGISTSRDYFGYLYTSREMYLTTDEIRVWGYIHPIEGEGLPNNVTVALGGETEYVSYYLNMSQTVDVAPDGSFSCAFQIQDAAPEWPMLGLYADGELVYSKSITVNDYEKPVYVLEASTDKEIYFADEIEEVSISIRTSFFDGTPAGNMPIAVSTDWEGEDLHVQSDDNGESTLTVAYDRGDSESWYPSNANISINSNELDSVDSYYYLSPTLIYHDTMVQGRIEENGSLSINVNRIELGDIDTSDELYADNYPENIRGRGIDTTVSVSVLERYQERTVTGSYYDFVYKRNVDTYTYETVEVDHGVYSVDIIDGYGSLPAIDMNEGSSYEFTISTEDSDGYAVTDRVFHYEYEDDSPGEAISNLVFTGDGENVHSSQFEPGQDLALTIEDYNEALELEGGRYLAFMQQQDLYGAFTGSGSSLVVQYDRRNLPNANISGAYYLNGRIYAVASHSLMLDSKQWGLNVEITPLDDELSPGDEAGVQILVTDQNGDPVQGAALCLSVSDEAAFAVQPQQVEFLADMYAYKSWGFTNVFVSYADGAGINMMAEMGGEGAGEFRKEFVDDLVFETLTTDSSGMAELSFTLADNLTSWRITALAASGDMVGNGVGTVAAGLDMFVSPTFSDTFLTGDDISFGSRTYGTAIDSGEIVEYEAIILDSQGEELARLTASSPAGDNAHFNFGPLQPGQYTLRLSGQWEEHSDGVELEFQVVDTAAELWLIKEMTVEEIRELQPQKYPVILTISDGAYKTYAQALSRLGCMSPIRMDQLAAKVMWGRDMAKLTGDGDYATDLPSLTPLKAATSYISELEAGSGSAYFSARMAAAVPGSLNKDRLTTAFAETLNNYNASTEELTSAYLGLAAFGEPVLISLRSFYEQNYEHLDQLDLLRLGQAFALLGDFQQGMDIYEQIVSPSLSRLTLPGGESYLRLDLGGTEEANVEQTALALAMASLMDLEERDELASYIIYAIGNLSSSDETLFYPLCELMLYVSRCQPSSGSQAAISYELDGQTTTLELDSLGFSLVRFNSREELANANLQIISGEPYIQVSYLGSLEDIDGQKSPHIQVQKSIESSASLGDNITVTLTVTADKDGWVSIEDYVPTGFRLADRASYVDGQSIRFFKNVENGTATVTYKIKAVIPGSFVVEAPVVARTDNGLLASGNRSQIQVDP